MSSPVVSVILPVFNRASTLRRCVESVLAQTHTDWELVAVDDGSSDNSLSILEGFGDPRIRVLCHPANRGPSAARNTALAAARGEFFALLDSDDEWLPEKLAAQLTLLQSGQCDLCGCEYWQVEDGRERHLRLPEPDSWAKVLHTKCELGNGTTLVVRRLVVDEIGPFDESLRLYEDWDWVLRMVVRFRYAVVRQPLARVHFSGSRSAERFASGAEHFLRKHDAEFARHGAAYRRKVRGKHFEYVAASAFDHRQYTLGCRYLLKSYAAHPAQSPHRLGALVLAPIDALCGTSFIRRIAARLR